ncbi:MAG: TolC family protein [Deltaproteobacteria bacterium]|nr:TolC family protein [Deltaproteobacteria bacterium]
MSLRTPTLLVLALLAPRPGDAAPLSLDRAIQLALAHNELARAADERRLASDARVTRARAYFFPNLVGTASYSRRSTEVTRQLGTEPVTLLRLHGLQATVTLSQTLFDPRSYPLYRQALEDRKATRSSSEHQKRLLRFETAQAFLSTLTLEWVVQSAGRRLALARQNLADARARYGAQLSSSNDVTKAELESAIAERELTRARASVATARLQLGHLLNTEVSDALEVPEPLLALASAKVASSQKLVEEARRQRLDLRASEGQLRALRAFASEPLLRVLPSLVFSGQVKATNEPGFVGKYVDWSLGLSLSWTLFDGGVWYGEWKERRAQTRAAEAETEARSRQVALDVRRALVEIENAQAASRLAQVAVDAAAKNARETAALYRQGLASALENADASTRLFDAEVNFARERYGLAIAYLNLRAALGHDPLPTVEERRS